MPTRKLTHNDLSVSTDAIIYITAQVCDLQDTVFDRLYDKLIELGKPVGKEFHAVMAWKAALKEMLWVLEQQEAQEGTT